MKLFILILCSVIILFNSFQLIFATVRSIKPNQIVFFLFKHLNFQKNTLIFERVVCDKNTSDWVSNVTCILKRSSQYNLLVDVGVNLNYPVYKAFFHAVFYYRYNGIVYKTFPIDVFEDCCEWLIKRNQTGWLEKNKYFILETAFGPLLKYSNINHSCPYVGPIYVKADLPLRNFYYILDYLVPAGRYRVDWSLTDGNKNHIFMSGKLYAAVSDHRIEQF